MTTGPCTETWEFLTKRNYALSSYALTYYVALRDAYARFAKRDRERSGSRPEKTLVSRGAKLPWGSDDVYRRRSACVAVSISVMLYIYIYIYIERERERDADVCVYLSLSLSIHIYIYIYIERERYRYTSCCVSSCCVKRAHRLFTLLELWVSCLRRGRANGLCTFPSLTDDPRRKPNPMFTVCHRAVSLREPYPYPSSIHLGVALLV